MTRSFASPALFQPVPLDEIVCSVPPNIDWLWHGYLAARNITMLTSQWKCGKTTLLACLLARLATGGTLAGQAVRPGRAIVISEEAPELWAERRRQLGPMPNVELLCRPFRGRPSLDQWHALIESLVLRCQSGRLDLVVIDPLATFLPARTENNASVILDTLLPLQSILAEGAAVLVLHHPRKGEPPPGHTARGSGALTSCVDVLLEMTWYGRPDAGDRRRILRGFSRHPATPLQQVIERTADGTDYRSHGDLNDDDFGRGWPVLRGVLEDAPGKLTRREILDLWPEDHPRPDATTLWRWLDRALLDHRVQQSGRGRCGDPYRYWIPGYESRWLQSFLAPLPPLPPLTGVPLTPVEESLLATIATAEAELILHRDRRK